MRQKLEKIAASGDAKTLRRFLLAFGDDLTSDRARDQLVERLSGRESLLERELILRKLVASADASRRSAAEAKLAKLLANVGRAPRESTPVWPEGAVTVETKEVARFGAGPLRIALMPIEVRSQQGWPSDFRLFFDPQLREMVGRDGFGRDLFQVSMADGRQQQLAMLPMNHCYAMAKGNLVIVFTGSQVFALDTQKGADGSGGRILWQKDLCAQPIQRVPMPWGATVRMPLDRAAQVSADVGPLTSDTLCYLSDKELTAVDPMTGNALWTHKGIEPGSEVFGDDKVTIVAPPSPTKPYKLFRTSDGKELGDRTIPQGNRWVTIGTRS